jgi:DNA polymerase III epsilon subunit family exonuclease
MYNFRHDIVLIDLEATGLFANQHEIIQIGAIVLDKKTLKEKKSFSTFIKPKKWQKRNHESMQVNKITWETLKDAPSLEEAITDLEKIMPKQMILAYYAGIFDIEFMKAAYAKLKKSWPYDHHYFNIWGLFYGFASLHLPMNNKKKFAGFGLEDLAEYFKITVTGNLHDALTDCRLEADILRKVMETFSKKK